MILINLKAGLANRLRTLLAFYQVALNKGQLPLKYAWTVDRMCNGAFKDLFEALPGTEEVSEDYYAKNHKKAWTHFWGQGTFSSIVRHYRAFPRNEDHRQVELRLYQQLQLRPELATTVATIRQRFNLRHALGVHVRRTDHLRFAQTFKAGPTTDQEFFKFIDKHPTHWPIYLATDNASTQEIYRQRYGQRIMVYQPIAPDADPNCPLGTREVGRAKHRRTGLDHAIIDLYLLASCQTFKGSRFSSFSELAETLSRSRAAERQLMAPILPRVSLSPPASPPVAATLEMASPTRSSDSEEETVLDTPVVREEPCCPPSGAGKEPLVDLDSDLPIYLPPHPDTVLSVNLGGKYDRDFYE